MRAARIDDNQPAIVQAMRVAGCLVQSLAGLGNGVPDLLVGLPDKTLILIEVKDGDKYPSEQALTMDQGTWHEKWKGYPIYVVNSVEQALALIPRPASGTTVK
jgi:hypothetical protein